MWIHAADNRNIKGSFFKALQLPESAITIVIGGFYASAFRLQGSINKHEWFLTCLFKLNVLTHRPHLLHPALSKAVKVGSLFNLAFYAVRFTPLSHKVQNGLEILWIEMYPSRSLLKDREQLSDR